MTRSERAEKIAELFGFSKRHPCDKEALTFIAAQIVEAEREACKKFSKSCLCYAEGFRAARKKAKGIAESTLQITGIQIAQRIREIEP